MKVLGLTGSIGMGKSTAAAMLKRLGLPVHDSDAEVHRLLGPGGAAVEPIERVFPGTVSNREVDRAALGARVFGEPSSLRELESILHPLVRRSTERFLQSQARAGQDLVVLDIPLLFETGGIRHCDAVIAVSAPLRVQRSRVLRRPGMSEKRLRSILAQQMPDAEKRRLADFVVWTGLGKRHSLRQLVRIVRFMRTSGLTWKNAHARNRPRHRDHRARSFLRRSGR